MSDDSSFLVQDLLIAAEGESLDGGGALLEAMVAVLGTPTGRALGRWLSSMELRTVNSMTVHRIRNTRDGWRWVTKNMSSGNRELTDKAVSNVRSSASRENHGRP